MKLTLNSFASIEQITAESWNQLNLGNNSFLQHCFLLALEKSGSVSPETGWTTAHKGWFDSKGKLQAVLPLYYKTHSYGEYMFDWDWARGISEAGMSYYPKIVSAIPFTPVPGQRLMISEYIQDQQTTKEQLIKQLFNTLQAAKISNLQCLFLTEKESLDWRKAGAMIRQGYQFSWYNNNYQSFDDFLATLRSSARKKIRRDRRLLAENAVQFKHFEDCEIDDKLWDFFIQCYQQTYIKRSGHKGYLNRKFFQILRQTMAHQLLIVCAFRNNQPIAASLFIKGDDILYGRYWGTMELIDGLHFDCCYYQGIDFCIRAGVKCMQPGTQGDYKRRRGFIPEAVYGAYYFTIEELQRPIQNYLIEETDYLEKQFEQWINTSPYK